MSLVDGASFREDVYGARCSRCQNTGSYHARSLSVFCCEDVSLASLGFSRCRCEVDVRLISIENKIFSSDYSFALILTARILTSAISIGKKRTEVVQIEAK